MSATDPETTRAVYDAEAAAFDAQQSRPLFEARWLARFAAGLPAAGHVLDLGCGAGEHIARWFMAEGFRLTGVDVAPAMLDITLRCWPEVDWYEADMRSLDLGQRFDGIVVWDSLYHLTSDDQRRTLSRIADHLRSGGTLLATVAPGQARLKVRWQTGPSITPACRRPDTHSCWRTTACGSPAFLRKTPSATTTAC
ncbi:MULTISPECIES: class I SAM-dependent methyltransferase [unclassified Sulfitobacter]|uniref:class I SAM-dependent methyltransferase n=1 Tax=unclassified Sulfitobacter TaxID=196795 RepID=UPI0007C21A3C|nr:MULTISPECIES: class I SAM-dependent methyltransferase [unclassified Sulfitobacter]KZY04285.1 hypothetical protein A3721_02960 [Sulfitobacter sp. HI0023]KZY24126.1 hypothetical protein A3728_06405 [Sulfitobacter sp. HI0040]KZZ70641.1 hypothetical protein A3764_07445 [Sulfitobacter sp. HI0129]